MENPRPEKVAVVDEVREPVSRQRGCAAHRVPRHHRGRRLGPATVAARGRGRLQDLQEHARALAARDLGLELEELLTGPTAIAFVDGDAVSWPRRCATSPRATRT